MMQAHTEIVLRDQFMVADEKITDQAHAFLTVCRRVNPVKYADYGVSHVFGRRLQFGCGDSLPKPGQSGTSCIDFLDDVCVLTETDTSHELLLGFLMVFADAHPAVTLSVTTSAPTEFLHNVFRVARAFSPDLPKPAWLPDREDISLDLASLPSDLDFRA